MDIEVLDVRRVFLGDLSWTFLVEITLRTAFLYAYTFVVIRAMSRRAIGELSLIEVVLIVALGSAVGDPMFYPDVPLLHGMVVITTVVLLNQGFGALVRRSTRVELLMEGAPSRVIQDGRVDLEGIRRRGMGRDELFEVLRNEGVTHLGEVRVAYMEQNGRLSVFRYDAGGEKKGLRIEPPEEIAPFRRYGKDDRADADDDYACHTCGEVRHFQLGEVVQACEEGHFDWARRVGGPGHDGVWVPTDSSS